MKHEINLGTFPMPESATKRAQAALKMAITVHNAAIEEAAQIADRRAESYGDSEYTLGCDDTARSLAEDIRKLKRAP